MKEDKLKKFIADKVMAQAVYDVIRDAFLVRRGMRDTQILAAERLAVDFLEDAWHELDKYKADEVGVSPPLRQVGL